MVFPSKLKMAVLPIKHVFEILQLKNGSTVITGVEGMFFDILSSKLKFEYELVIPEDGEWGILDDTGNWTGLLGLLEKNEADIAIGLAITEQRYEVFDFSVPYSTEDMIFMAPKQSSTILKNPFLEPFSMSVWWCLIGSFIIASTIFSFKTRCPIINVLFDFLAILMRQPVKFRQFSTSGEIVMYSWLLFTAVISSSYSATLLSHLALPLQKQPLQTFKDLANAVQLGTHRCLVTKGDSSLPFLQTSSEEHLKLLFENIQKNKWFFRGLDDLHLENIKDSVIIESRDLLQILIGRLGTESHDMSNEVLMVRHVSLAFKKEFCCKRELNDVLSRLRSAGLMIKLRSDQMNKNKMSINAQTSEPQVLLREIYSVFTMVTLAHIVAFVVLIAELIHYRLRRAVNI